MILVGRDIGDRAVKEEGRAFLLGLRIELLLFFWRLERANFCAVERVRDGCRVSAGELEGRNF